MSEEIIVPIVEGESALSNPIAQTEAKSINVDNNVDKYKCTYCRDICVCHTNRKLDGLSCKCPKRPEGGPVGNNKRMKWKTPEERLIACDLLCKELEQGLPKEYLDIADWQTVERYMRDFPVEFDTERIEAAIRHGIRKLVNLGYVGMSGKVDGFVPRTWEFITQNMTHWKLRHDNTTNNKDLPAPILGGTTKDE